MKLSKDDILTKHKDHSIEIKDRLRDQLESDINAFIAKGGKINHLDYGIRATETNKTAWDSDRLRADQMRAVNNL